MHMMDNIISRDERKKSIVLHSMGTGMIFGYTDISAGIITSFLSVITSI
jgi:hypothetical protein